MTVTDHRHLPTTEVTLTSEEINPRKKLETLDDFVDTCPENKIVVLVITPYFFQDYQYDKYMYAYAQADHYLCKDECHVRIIWKDQGIDEIFTSITQLFEFRLQENLRMD